MIIKLILFLLRVYFKLYKYFSKKIFLNEWTMIVKVASINWVYFILVFSHSLFNSEAFDIVHSDFISLFLDNGSNLLEFWHNNFLFVFLFLFLEVLRSSIRNFVKFLFAWNQHKFLHIILSSFALHVRESSFNLILVIIKVQY